ncbi:MAG: serine hydrolase, partial [Bacteroidota bacterium]
MKACFFYTILLLTSINIFAQRNVLEKIIREQGEQFGDWAQDPDAYEVQVLYTQIDRDAEGRPSFTTYRFGADPNRYFYPASTVKMPTAFLALEKLNELGVAGLDKYAVMHNYAGTAPQTAALVDTSSASGSASVANYVEKIFLVSDNDAHNRLYEFLGQAELNKRLQAKSFNNSRVIHRLSVSGFDTLGNRWLNPISFGSPDSTVLSLPERYDFFYDSLAVRNQVRGYGYLDSEQDSIVYVPFDF